ncbi:hypothetical protein CHUUTOTORO_01750 [Serratia phage vB_SmaM-ChuuTotoro]|nr:hypothetical protein CHUUTOTORO_01750 [Serratia phage vB_SmaM-ChuuTotoro]
MYKTKTTRSAGKFYTNKKAKVEFFVRDLDDKCFMRNVGEVDFVSYIGDRHFTAEGSDYEMLGAVATITELA